MPQDPATMTARQLDRRQRVIRAVQDLVVARGPGDLQVKDIADYASVSLAAIYRYFSSKEHMLAEALLDWAGQLPGRRPITLAGLVRQGVAGYRRSPHFAALFLDVAASQDPNAVASFGQMSRLISGAMYEALPPMDPTLADEIVRIVGNAWLGGLFNCVHGLTTFDELERSLATACTLLLQPAAN